MTKPEVSLTRAPRHVGPMGLFLRKPVAVVALAVLLVIIFGCAFAPLLTSVSPLDQDLSKVLKLPSAQHILGTDTLGRDVFVRLLFGGRPALLGSLEAVVVFAAIGIIVGLIAGYSTNWLDRVISVLVDILMSLPGIVVMFAVLALFNNNLAAAMVTLGLFSSGGLIRVVRAATKATREELYVSAARVSGIGTMRILLRHITPRLVGPVVIQVSLFAGLALVVQSGLGYLNMGVIAPAPSWGGMVGEASHVLSQSKWLLVPSGGIIAITVLALGLIGDAVRDVTAESVSRTGGMRVKQPRARAAITSGGDKALVAVDGLTISFIENRQLTTVVHGISFQINPGELVGLVGESGSGKTVTVMAMLGLLPSNAQVSATSLTFDGQPLTGLSNKRWLQIRGNGIGLVSQEPMMALDPCFTVGHQLAEAVAAHGGFTRNAARLRALELLGDVRLPNPGQVMSQYPHELSGGMAQRVVIAIALAGSPRLLLADEPTTALDVTVQAEILDLLRLLRDEHGMAILLVTHDLGVVADFCERAAVMQNGYIVEENDVESLFACPEQDYTKALIEATPSLIDLDSVGGGN